MNTSSAWEELSVSDGSDPNFLLKLLSYLSETASDIFPENPAENSFHMNESKEIFVCQNGSWLNVEIIKNTEDYLGSEENPGMPQ
jgi:hypothetical protein